jgi:thiamine-phosphate pyrophosphorylase
MYWNMKEQLSLYLVMSLDEYDGRTPLELAKQALAGGVTMLQLRDKKASALDILEKGAEIYQYCREYNIPFLLNDRVDLAIILDADGVHVGQDDIPGDEVRRLLGPNKIVGISAGTIEEAERAMAWQPDYLGVGAIYQTLSKQDAGLPVGTSFIQAVRQRWRIPMVGIGGINESNAAEVYRAGAEGIAVVSAITQSNEPLQAARRLLKQKSDH